MTIKTLLSAAAALALLGGAAHAEGPKSESTEPAQMQHEMQHDGDAMMAPGMDASTTTAMPDTSVNPPADDSAVMPPASADASAQGVDTSTTVSANATTNGPVADTPENRAKYKPLSRAGRATAARGN